jgi:hypothetical protein
VSIAAAEAELGLVAISRAETRTGADYYLSSPGAIDLEEAVRLEVSGNDRDGATVLKRRLREKCKQALDGESSLPAIASVVGFKETRILIRRVEDANVE